MKKTRLLLSGIALGAGCSYFFDPQCGKRRRNIARDRGQSMLRKTTLWLEKAVRDLRHRVEGSVAEATGMLDFSTPGDAQLIERVRARLGHIASHPRLIEVAAHDGRITLHGHAPAEEIGRIALSISTLRGVRGIDNQLDDQLGPEVATQNGHWHAVPSLDVLRENWAPGTRLAIGTLGGVLMLRCALRATPKNILLGTLGFGLMARAVSNRDTACMIEEGGKMARPIFDRMRKRGAAPVGMS